MDALTGWLRELPLVQLGRQALAGTLTSSFEFPSPVGLGLGIAAVAVGQVGVLIYHYYRKEVVRPPLIQAEPKQYTFAEGLVTHLSQPEGFLLLGAYLSGTWMLRLMPASYYSFDGGINWYHVLAQLLLQDALQTLAHYLEHKISAAFYQASHKPHHRFTNPRLFDAFDGSLGLSSGPHSRAFLLLS